MNILTNFWINCRKNQFLLGLGNGVVQSVWKLWEVQVPWKLTFWLTLERNQYHVQIVISNVPQSGIFSNTKETNIANKWICNDIFTAFFRSYLIFHFQISYRVHQFMLDTDNLGVLIVQRSWKPIKIWKDISGFILEKNLLAANIVNIHATEKVL